MPPSATSTELSSPRISGRPGSVRAVSCALSSSSRLRLARMRIAPSPIADHQHQPSNSGCASGRDPGEQQQAVDGAQGVGAEDRSHHPAAAAQQRRAADHHRGDRLQRVVGAHLRIARQRLQRQEQPAARRQHPRQRVGRQPRPPDPHAGQECRRLG